MRFDGLVQAGRFKLLSRDARQHYAVAPREREFTGMCTGGLNQLLVALEGIDHLNRAVTSLGQGVDDDLDLNRPGF